MKGTFWRPGRIAALTLVALITLGAWIASGTVMVVSAISVQGSELVPADEVIKLSGLQYGQAMLTIDTASIKQHIESNRFLRFVSLDRQYPSRVVINVKTRKPFAVIQHVGNYLLTDSEGVVLATYTQMDFAQDLPIITGLDLPEAKARLDACVLTNSTLQSRVTYEIIADLYAQGVCDSISELNVSELDNLYLVTLDGIQVKLGDRNDLDKKLTLAMAVLPQLPVAEVSGGLLDVTAVNKADYMQQAVSKTSGL